MTQTKRDRLIWARIRAMQNSDGSIPMYDIDQHKKVNAVNVKPIKFENDVWAAEGETPTPRHKHKIYKIIGKY